MGQCEDRLSKKFQAGQQDAYYKPIRIKINAYRYTRKGFARKMHTTLKSGYFWGMG